MKKQVITDLIEKVAELHVEYLKTGEGCSLITRLSKIESERKGGLESPCSYRSKCFGGCV